MSEWLVVLLGLLGVEPAAAEPQPEATVTPVIELAVPELAGAERQFVRFTDDLTGVAVQRLIMRNDIGFAIADYRTARARKASTASRCESRCGCAKIRATSPGWCRPTPWPSSA